MYALHSIIINKSIPLEDAVRQAQDISKKQKIFMRELKHTFHFRNIPKTKFINKSFRSKKINDNITLVFGELKQEHERLYGKGIFSDAINYGLRKLAPRVINAVTKSNEFNNISSKTLLDYGNYTIKHMQIYRTPISTLLNSALNLISLGKWNDLRSKYGFDKLFHTALVCDIGGKNIIIEKNEVVNISTQYKTSKDTETFNIDMSNKSFTINDMIMSCKKRMGDKDFFDYDAFRNNCQVFIKNMLESVDLYTTDVSKFLFQDLSEIYSKLPSYTSKIAKLITRAGAFISRLKGDGNDEEKQGHHLIREEKYGEEKEREEKYEDEKEREEKKQESREEKQGFFNKGFRVGYYMAYHPLNKLNKSKLLELCDKYHCEGIDENTTNKVLKEKLNLLGANIDLLDKVLEEQEINLQRDIRADKELRMQEHLEPITNYHKSKKRFNTPLNNLTHRELILLCKEYKVKGSYGNWNKEELKQGLREAGYR